MYRIAIVTTAMESGACPRCTPERSSGCVNETGESGRFQDRLGHITWLGDQAEFDFVRREECRVVTSDNLDCFYDEQTDRGTVLVGTTGCGYERGLEAMRTALTPELLQTHNADFLRDEALLVVVLVSDEEDCGKVGEVTEGIAPAQAKLCYYAAAGSGPDGSACHPMDEACRPYQLTPVEDYHRFLLQLKGDVPGMVKFAAITGVTDPGDPASTLIEYESSDPSARILSACVTPGCGDHEHCHSKPATRYIQLARLFGSHGFVDTICQENFANTMGDIYKMIECPESFGLREELSDPDLVALLVNGREVPRFICDDGVRPCLGSLDESCAPGVCAQTWTYDSAPGNNAPGGRIDIAPFFDLCEFGGGGDVYIELRYVPDV
jgi:hypothetical protein